MFHLCFQNTLQKFLQLRHGGKAFPRVCIQAIPIICTLYKVTFCLKQQLFGFSSMQYKSWYTFNIDY